MERMGDPTGAPEVRPRTCQPHVAHGLSEIQIFQMISRLYLVNDINSQRLNIMPEP